ncbi:MAG: CRTAC1 family protein, partial [Bacteroidota bacterium]
MKVLWQTVILVFFSMALIAQGPNTLFTLKQPNETGVDFNNQVQDKKEHNIQIYSNYYGGGGVGIGDFNRDGLPDLFFAGNLVPDELYLNKGNLQFTKSTEAAGIEDNGGWSSGVLVADVNGDQWPDIYVTRELYDDKPDLRKNKLYINQQDGTFKEQSAHYGLDDDGRTRHATFLDYDRDGDLDLFLLNQPPNPGNYSSLFGENLKKEEYAMRLYRNDGTKFVDVSKEAGVHKAAYPNSVTASDLNNDGWTDLYIANDYEAPDFLLINQKDGTFKEEIKAATRHISFYSMGVDAADINNDGWLDVMVLDMVAEDNFRLKANMSAMNPAAFWKVVADGGHYQYMFNSLHLNQGVDQKGQLILSDIAQMANMPSTDWSWSNLFADLDNDGYKDIYITNGLLRDIRNSDAAKTFPKYVEKTINEWVAKNPNAGDVSIWDILDLDEAMKLIPSEKLKNYVYQNNGDLTFTKKQEDWGLNNASFSNGSAYADLDLDGDLDLVVNNINEPAFIYENNARQSGSNNYLRIALENSKNTSTLLGARVKINYDQTSQWHELTNVRGMYSTSEQVVHFGLNQTDKIEEVIVTWPDQSETILKNVKANQLITIDFAKAKKTASSKVEAQTPLFVETDLKIDFKHRENDF